MIKRHIPGLALTVIRHGRVTKMSSYGQASLEFSVPVTSKTIFNVASVTKTVTAVAVMKLVEAGKLKLDDSIGKYLEGLPDGWPQYRYNQTNYVLLGLLIEKLSRLSYTRFCQTQLFGPAGLTNAQFGDTQKLIKNRGPIYTPYKFDAQGKPTPTDLRLLHWNGPPMAYLQTGSTYPPRTLRVGSLP
jgi:CubicO group peptidase (beta-lactamase class C family)